MKLRVLSLILPALLSSVGSVNAAEIYNKDGNKLDLFGKITGSQNFYNNHDNNNNEKDHSYLFLGLKGNTKITEQLSGYGTWEYQTPLNNTEINGKIHKEIGLGYIGLKFADLGSLDYGRNYGVLYDIASWTDVLPKLGNGGTYGSDQFLFHAANGVATYRNNNFFGLVDGLNFAIQYQGKSKIINEDSLNQKDILKQNGNGWGVSSSYNLGDGFSVGAAMFQSDRTKEQNTGITGLEEKIEQSSIINNPSYSSDITKKAQAYSGAVKYNLNNVYLAAMYTKSYNATRFGLDANASGYANKANHWELVAQYQFDFGLRPSIGYVTSRAVDIKNWGKQNLKNYIDVGATYTFNKNMSTYIDYQHNLLKNNDFTKAAHINTDDIISMGLTYNF